MRYLLTICCLYILPAFSQNPQGIIPLNRQADWAAAGLGLPGTPVRADNFLDVTSFGAVPDDGQDDFPAVQKAIQSARSLKGLTLIFFPPGTYHINSRLELTAADHDLVLQGAGADKTNLIFTTGSNSQCFYIHGEQASTRINIVSAISKGSKDLYCDPAGAGMLKTGDWIRFCALNHPVYDSWAQGCVGQITQLHSVDPGHLVMLDAAAMDYDPADTLYLWKIEPARNIGIENLKIFRNDPQTGGSGSNFHFLFAVNCWIRGVESEFACRHHAEIDRSAHLEISGCYFQQARGICNGGYGYGVDLHCSTSACLIENNIFRLLRHAMLVQAGANGNVFGYNYSLEQVWSCGGGCPDGRGPDICIHGNYPFANLFEGNAVTCIRADGEHGSNGPYNTFFRNRTHDRREACLWNSDRANFVANENSAGVDTDLDDIFELIGNLFSPRRVQSSVDIIDVYALRQDRSVQAGTDTVDHARQAEKSADKTQLYLNETSYYLAAPPEFMTGYAWPLFGPPVSSTSEQSTDGAQLKRIIPAEDRYKNGNYTFISKSTQCDLVP